MGSSIYTNHSMRRCDRSEKGNEPIFHHCYLLNEYLLSNNNNTDESDKSRKVTKPKKRDKLKTTLSKVENLQFIEKTNFNSIDQYQMFFSCFRRRYWPYYFRQDTNVTNPKSEKSYFNRIDTQFHCSWLLSSYLKAYANKLKRNILYLFKRPTIQCQKD